MRTTRYLQYLLGILFPLQYGLSLDTQIISDFVYWRPFQDNLAYVVRIREDHLARFKTIDFEGSPGYRIGFGFHEQPRLWDTSLVWTRFYNRSSSAVRAPSRGQLAALWVPEGIDGTDIRKASEVWRLQYDIVDAGVGYWVLQKASWKIRPWIGLRGARIAQHIRCQYDDVHELANPSLFDLKVRAKDRYSGVGLRGGVEFELICGRGWSLFSKGSGSVLYGEYTSKWRYIGQESIRNDESQVRMNGEGVLGLQWQGNHWTLGLSYEWIWWSAQEGMTPEGFVADQRGLSLQGGTASVCFNF